MAVLLEGLSQLIGAFVKTESGVFLVSMASDLAVTAISH